MKLTIVGLLSLMLVAIPSVGCHHGLAKSKLCASQDPASATSIAAAAPPFPTPPVLAGSADVAGLVAKVKPAVVNITTIHEVKVPRLDFDWPFGFPSLDGVPFGKRRTPREDDTVKQQALGSGFFIDAQGHVVTNAHVVEGADLVRVRLADEREFEATVKGRDQRLDLAVLELKGAKDIPVAALGSSEALRVGEYVVAIGNPFGLGNTVTMGIVSAKGRTLGAGPYDDFIQTDASINPGNSGGPLFNLRGEVVGINAAINPNGRGIGFAIPVDALKEVLPQLITTGHVSRGRLGVLIQPVDRALGKALGMEKPHGALVGEVQSGGPAEKAGLAPGDVITAVDGTSIEHSQDLPRLIARHPPGTRVSVKVLRDKAVRTFEVTLDALPDKEEAENSPRTQGGSGLGVTLSDTPDGKVVVEGVSPNGPAADELRPRDVIRKINRKSVSRAVDAQKALREVPKGDVALLEIERNGARRFVALEQSDKK